MTYPTECPSCSGSMTNGKCDWSACGLDLRARNAPVEPAATANLTDADRAALPLYIKAGRNNPWISGSYDPPFNERSFYRCTTREEFWEKMRHGNWSNGTAFLYGSLCFIEQGNSNDEWLTVKLFGDGDDLHYVAFESISWYYILTRKPEEADPLLDDLLAATEEECRNLTYRDSRKGGE